LTSAASPAAAVLGRRRRDRSTVLQLRVLLSVDDVGMLQRQLRRTKQHVVHRLNTQHQAVVLVGNLVLPLMD